MNEPQVIEMPKDIFEREQYMEKFISDKHSLPDAVICESNNLSFILLKTCAKHFVRVPEDISVIGICTSRFADNSYPSLSTIEAPLYDMGKVGAKMLVNIINENTVLDNITLSWDFIPRESC